MTLDPHIESVPEPETPDVVVDPETPAVLNLQRRLKAIIALGVAGLALMAWLWINSSGTSDQIDSLIATNKAQQVLIDKLATQLDAARAQGAAVPAPEVVAAQTPGAEVSPVETVAPGIPGERGDAGPVGETGASGTGVSGSQGDTGATGAQGDTGNPGVNGADGTNGQTGSAGANGGQGDPGPGGVQGDPGVAGPAGADGAPGAQGPPGPGPTDQQIADAVAAYCSVPGNCGTPIIP